MMAFGGGGGTPRHHVAPPLCVATINMPKAHSVSLIMKSNQKAINSPHDHKYLGIVFEKPSSNIIKKGHHLQIRYYALSPNNVYKKKFPFKFFS